MPKTTQPGALTPNRPPDRLSRGSREPLTVLEARRAVLTFAGPLDCERVPLTAALGRILASGQTACADSPSADVSAVDGFAVSHRAPVPPGSLLTIVGEAAAGKPWSGALRDGEAVRIFTGAVLPATAERVIMAECVQAHTHAALVTDLDVPGHVRRRGENHRTGDQVLAAGVRLSPLELAIAAGAGAAELAVVRAPRVVHLVTGSELVAAGGALLPGQVIDSNGPLIAGLCHEAGARLIAQQVVVDDLTACLDAVAGFPAFDVLLISGGAGRGSYDLALPLLAALNFEVHFRSVAMRPGKPLAFANRERALAFALPGNPVSHWATWHLFVAPALRRLAGGANESELQCRRGRLEEPWSAVSEDREVFWPARAEATRDGGWSLRPARFLNSGDLTGIAGANALLRPPQAGGRWPAGAEIEFIACP